MAKRKRPVTLAEMPARFNGPRNKVGQGHEDATRERLRKARKNSFEDGKERVDAAPIDAQGVRRLADPFDILRARGLLAVGQPEMNAVLWDAGEKYRQHWHGAGMAGAQAMDLSRDIVDGGTGVMGLSEHVMGHMQELKAANVAIGPRAAAFVVGVVLHGESIASLAGLVRESARARTAEALALDRLREGLHRLCELWKMKPDSKRRRPREWRAFGGEWIEDPEEP